MSCGDILMLIVVVLIFGAILFGVAFDLGKSAEMRQCNQRADEREKRAKQEARVIWESRVNERLGLMEQAITEQAKRGK